MSDIAFKTLLITSESIELSEVKGLILNEI